VKHEAKLAGFWYLNLQK